MLSFPAEAAFELVEYDFKPYETIQIAGSLQNQGRVITNLKRDRLALKRRYQEIISYKFMDWNVAALLGSAILTSCLRRNFMMYHCRAICLRMNKTPIENSLTSLLDRLKTARSVPTNMRSKRLRRNVIMNEWTVKIQTSLNKYKAEEYLSSSRKCGLMRCCTQATRFIFPSKPRPAPTLKRTRKRKRLDHPTRPRRQTKIRRLILPPRQMVLNRVNQVKRIRVRSAMIPPPAVDDEKSGADAPTSTGGGE